MKTQHVEILRPADPCTVVISFCTAYFIIFVLLTLLHEISLCDLPFYWKGKTQTQRKDTLTVNSCLKPAKEIENL
jgi:hypothetical protein